MRNKQKQRVMESLRVEYLELSKELSNFSEIKDLIVSLRAAEKATRVQQSKVNHLCEVKERAYNSKDNLGVNPNEYKDSLAAYNKSKEVFRILQDKESALFNQLTERYGFDFGKAVQIYETISYYLASTEK